MSDIFDGKRQSFSFAHGALPFQFTQIQDKCQFDTDIFALVDAYAARRLLEEPRPVTVAKVGG